MKRLLKILGVLLVLLIAALFILPPFFKDDIKAAIKKELASTVDAQVYFDENSFGLSLFPNFPNLTVTLDELGVVGNGVFEGDTLLDVKSLGVEVDLFKLFGGDVMVTGLELEEPHIFILGLEDGTANYDIMLPSEEGTEDVDPDEGAEASEEDALLVAIDHWSITDGSFIYYNIKYATLIDLEGLNMKGKGDLTSERFDLATELEIGKVGFEYDEVKYLNGQTLSGDIVLDMNYVDYSFAFKQNQLFINDFGLNFDGLFAMPEEGYRMDLTFASEESNFGSLLSLIPAYYSEDIAGLQATGNVQFDGSVKGLYGDESMPGFRLNLRVDDGEFHYPSLPAAAKDVNLHVIVDNPDGVMDNTSIDLENLNVVLGNTGQISGTASVKGLSNPAIRASIDGNVNLHTLVEVVPEETLDGIDLGGIFTFHLDADGNYNADTEEVPNFHLNLGLEDGKVAYAEYPIPMENIRLVASAENNTRQLNDTKVDLTSLHLDLDGEEMLITGKLRNLADYTWEATAEGALDLEKIAGVLHLEETDLKGHLEMNLATKGQYSALEAERYDELPTTGALVISDFRYASPDVPMPVEISMADLAFDPRQAGINQLDMTLGSSDIHLEGAVTNYLAYILEDDAVLKGTMDFTSNTLDLNELMATGDSEEVEMEDVDEDTTSSEMEVVVVPKTIDFTLNSALTKVYYDNLELDDLTGQIRIVNGQVQLNDLNFKSLDGRFAVSGVYDTQIPEDPKVNLDLDIEQISIPEAYKVSGVVRRMAPVAEHMTGKFSTDFSIATDLKENMMPDYGTLTGSGLIAVVQAALESGPLVGGLSETTKLGAKANDMTLKDVILSARVNNGRVSVQPFDVKVGDYTTTISGSGGLDGSLDYALAMEIPAGQTGQAINSLIAGFTGNTELAASSTINLNVGLGGTYREPKFSLLGSSASGGEGGNTTVAATVTNQVQEQGQQLVEDATQSLVEGGTDSLKSVLGDQLENADAEALKEQAQQAAEEAKNKVRDLFGGRRRNGGGGGN